MKKLFALFLSLYLNFCMPAGVMAENCTCGCSSTKEHILSTEQLANPISKSLSKSVASTENYYILCKGNVIKVAFECKFLSECAKEGDKIYFYVPKDILTECGATIIPIGSKLCGEIRGIYKQKRFNKNARVYLNLNTLVLPDGTELEIKAKPFSKDFSLVENGWMTAGKIAASTIGLGAVGTGAGVGLAFIPKPHKIAIGAGAGVAIGCFIGLVTGLVTPGLKYHAREDEEIKIIFCDDLWIPKECVMDY